jgi:hypothetical protein
MASDERSEAPREDSDKPNQRRAKDDTNYRSVAKRISGWTTNLLATSIVVLIALVFGRKLVQLWRPPSPAPNVSTPQQLAAFDDPFTPLRLKFGDSPVVMHRQPLVGSANEAVEQLCRSCSDQLTSSAPPTGKASPAELMLLHRLAGRRPRNDSPPQSSLYQLDEALPMVVGTKQVAARDAVRDDGKDRRRVVTWGIAVPVADNQWTLFSFSHKSGTDGANLSSDETASVALPPTTVHLMTIRWPGGGSVTAFSGNDQPEAWSKFYDEWFDERGFRRGAAWRQGDRWHARYSNRRENKIVHYDVQFAKSTMYSSSEAPSAAWRGMITETTTNINEDD